MKGWSYYRGKAVDANWLLKQGNWLYDDAYGVSEYYSGAIFGEKGDVFRLFVQVNLNGVECEKVFELEFGDPPPWGPSDPSKDCSQVYLHFYDSQNQQWMHNVAGKTIRIQADLLGYLAVFVTTSPTEHVDSPTSEGLTADFTGSTRANEFPEFGIYMLMRTYGVGEPMPNAKPPKGAENHWAAGFYATAKAKGIIDCSCVIKPEGSVTHREAAKFVMLAVNSKANQQLLTWEEVLEWVKGEPESALTHAEAATLLRKMDQVMRKQKLKEEV